MTPLDRVHLLTEQQKACLRLVLKGMVSKEIAQALGFTPSTVDTYLTSAISRLQVSSRREAARALESAEQSQDFRSQSGPIAELGHTANADAQRGMVDPEVPAANHSTRQLKAFLGLPPIGGRTHDYNIVQSLSAIFRIALLSALAFIACVVILKMGIEALR